MEITKVENNESSKIWALEMKDYEIDTDDGKLLVQGDILIGTFIGESNPYFKGVIFSKTENGYEEQGSSSLSEEEYKAQVKQAQEINL